ncbi:MAG: deoxyribodipyrimidine photo-lyase, partial [Gemmatimonadota bacterium]|nr:deoxyribodipyrimidine photo-lyase [Gemmatimonadota bacterium]
RVLYWMQRAQRAECNHALEYAVQRANERGEPLVVAFGLTDDYPGANLRHYAFLIEGLAMTARAVERRGARFTCRAGSPPEVALELAADASLVVCDRGYLRHHRAWRRRVAEKAGREVVEVETDVVVPVETVSEKAEYAARTIRPKIHRLLDDFLVDLRTTPLERRAGESADDPRPEGLPLDDPDAVLADLDVDRSVGAVTDHFPGGTAAARARLDRFLDEGLPRYADAAGDPVADVTSRLSPWLHFGQLSPLYVALRVREAADAATGRGAEAVREGAEAFLEQLIVRRELAANFARYTPDYDAFSSVPGWARRTLEAHAGDEREAVYTRGQLEAGETRDPAWNAAMRRMRETGWLHNRMRMYWGKRILAWTNTPRYAHRIARELNDRWFLDGRDPNGYANVGWLFGLHDRPWPERPVFGKVRSMTPSGLGRHFDVERWVESAPDG